MEILIIVTLIYLYNFLMRYVFKFNVNKSILCCGIGAYVGKDPANASSVKILGIYNVLRGSDACGIVVDNRISRGVKDLANFTNFIESKNIHCRDTDNNKVVLLHTRNASNKTTKNEMDCTHPFVISDKKGKPVLVGVHNGFISNADDLAKDYKVKEEKVDSKTLLTILAKQRKDTNPYKVLEEYEGAAVLLWYFVDEPNCLYIWKGGSKKYVNSDEVEEERPLFMYREKDDSGKFKDNYYFSSIKESLLAINGDTAYAKTDVDQEPTVSSIPMNCVIKVIPGSKYNIIPISRVVEKYSSTIVTATNSSYYPKTSSTSSFTKDSSSLTDKDKMSMSFVSYPKCKMAQNPIKSSSGSILIDNEPHIHNFQKIKNKVYFRAGRYYQNGHMLGKNLMDSYVIKYLDIDGCPKDHKDFNSEGAQDYYFYQGLLCLNKECAEKIVTLAKNGKLYLATATLEIDYAVLSKLIWGFAQKPGDTTNCARHGGNTSEYWANGKYYPMFDYDRVYFYKTGAFVKAEYVGELSAAAKKSVWEEFEKQAASSVYKFQYEYTNAYTTLPISKDGESTNNLVDDTINEEIINGIYDIQSSIKSVLNKLDSIPDDTKYANLKTLLKINQKNLRAKLVDLKPNNEDDSSDDSLNYVKGLLYS